MLNRRAAIELPNQAAVARGTGAFCASECMQQGSQRRKNFRAARRQHIRNVLLKHTLLHPALRSRHPHRTGAQETANRES